MKRYLRLYLHFIRFSFSRAMEFRLDFFFRIFMDTVFYFVQILFFKVIYLHSDSVGGWNEAQAMIFVASYLLIDALNMTLFSNNTWMLPGYVNRGELDYYLIRPVSSFFFLSCREFAANSFVNLIMAVGIFVWAIWDYPTAFAPLQVLLFVFLLFCGLILYHFLHMLFVIPVFWMQAPRGLEPLFWNMGKLMEKPHRIYTGPMRWLLLSLLPFSVVASLPVSFLFGESSWEVFGYCLLILAGFIILIRWLWAKALRSYSSASS